MRSWWLPFVDMPFTIFSLLNKGEQYKMKEDQIFYIDPLNIKVKEGLERYRRDLGDLKELGKSLEETGQIQPVVINRKHELIVGGRRIAACILRGMKVKVIYKDLVDPVKMRLWEIEENLRRKEFTPAEHALAVEEFHILMQQEHGESVSGRKGGHTLDKTAKVLGKTRGSVINELEIAEMVKAFPELKNATKKSEIKKAVKGLEKVQTAIASLKDYEEVTSKGAELFKLRHTDAVEFMKSLPDSSVDILLTDPLYAIGADDLMITLGGHTGGTFTTAGFKIKDDPTTGVTLLVELAKQSFRFTTPQAHGYVFVAPERFWQMRFLFMEAGWRVHVKPLIWIKREVGQCNIPSAWPSSCYEMLMYIRKDISKIVKEGQPDWIECPPVSLSNRLHPFEKPIPLLINLLERVCLPGQRLCDPFSGSAASIEAGLRMKLICEGCDDSLEAHSVAVKRINDYIKEQKNA